MWNVVVSLVPCQAGQEESLGQEERTGLGPASQPASQIPDSALSGSAQLEGEGHCDPWWSPLSSGQNSIHLNESTDMEGRTEPRSQVW